MLALVLSGGGARGAYQVGVIQHLLREREYNYKIYSGTSVGALNAAFLSMYAAGNEVDAAEDLASLWKTVNDAAIWKKWYYGLLGMAPIVLPTWLGGKRSVYSTAPLQQLVSRTLKPERIANSGKLLRVGAVNLETGVRHVWSEKDLELIDKAVLASSSFPMFFEPIEVEGALFTDGGVREISPIADAIEAGATEIHVVSTLPDRVVGKYWPAANGMILGQRILDTMSAEIDVWDVRACELYNALCSTGHKKAEGKKQVTLKVFRPSSILVENALDFNPALIAKNVERGLNDARNFGWDDSGIVAKPRSERPPAEVGRERGTG